MSQFFKQVREDVAAYCYDDNNGKIVKLLGTLEEKTKQRRENFVFGALVLVALYLIVGTGAQLLCNLIGFLFPAYASMKAIRTVQKDDDTQWLIYWTVFAVFSLIDFASDRIMGWFPIYFLAKVIFLIWLQAPGIRGAEVIYNIYLSPLMDRYGSFLAAAEGQASSSAYNAYSAPPPEMAPPMEQPPDPMSGQQDMAPPPMGPEPVQPMDG